MTDVQRHRYELSKQRVFPIIDGTSVNIEIGDLLYYDTTTHTVFPASNLTWESLGKYETQFKFRVNFAGMAADRLDTRYTKSGNILVDTAGIKEFAIASGTYYYGELVAPAKQTGNLLENQKVEVVNNPSLAIGRITQNTEANAQKVLVEIFDAVEIKSSSHCKIHTVSASEAAAGYAYIYTYAPAIVYIYQISRSGVEVTNKSINSVSATGMTSYIRIATNGTDYVLTTGDSIKLIFKSY